MSNNIRLKYPSSLRFSRFMPASLEIADDLIKGLLSSDLYVITVGRCQIVRLEFLIDHYEFPVGSRICAFISGHNPELYKRIKFYQDAVESNKQQ